MRRLRGLGLAPALLLLAPATAAHADTRLTWTCTASDRSEVQTVELDYAGVDPVPCKAFLQRRGASQLLADYDATRGQCERQVRDMLGSLVARGFSCDEPVGATLLGIEAFARGEAPSPAAPTEASPEAEGTPPAASVTSTDQDELYFAIVSKHDSEASARAAARQLRAADRSARPVILSPRDPGGSWLLALAAYTDAETAAKAVQYARQSGLGPGAYFWNVPRSQAATEMTGGD